MPAWQEGDLGEEGRDAGSKRDCEKERVTVERHSVRKSD
jgi:hypothetical protein